MPISYERWEEVGKQFLDEIIRKGHIDADKVHPFWNFYHQEFKPGYYDSMPCTCSGKAWSELVSQVANEYNAAKKEKEIKDFTEAQVRRVVENGN
jgi:hypothetical protein